jgi:hypothetical protein
VALLLSATLTGAALAGSPVSAATAPGAPAMPAALTPGSVTAPVFPLRSVPAFAGPTHASARVRSGDGGVDQRFNVPTPPGSTLLWGDWNRDGAYTPAVFTNGHWVIYDAMIGSAPVPSREFDFGMTGDKPVVGDFNRDGRTDVGVVRGAVWQLRGFPSAGPTWRRFAFGRPTDTPVTGDWNGDGQDGVGVRRGTRWLLLQTPAAPKRGAAPTYSFAFGQRSDRPVVGDWNGDAKDSVGVVRLGAWLLRDRLSLTPTKAMTLKQRRVEARSTVTRRVVPVPREPGTVPVSWTTPAGPTGAACATASAGVANRNQLAGLVRPSPILNRAVPYDPANPALAADPAFQLRSLLLESERYLLGAQYLDRWYSSRGQPYTDLLSRNIPAQQEYAIRRPAMAALTTAVAARTGVHSDTATGRSREDAIRYTDFLVRSIACQHAAVTPGGWGAGFQTAHWATLAGEAAWLIWDRLTPQTREYVAQMLAYEADDQTTLPVEYWADASGTVVSRGDTKAESDSWNSAGLELAISMMPTHPHAANWRRKAVDLEVAAYSRLSDINSPTAVNGVTLADRLDGANAYDDGTVENHHILHPDYMTNIQHNWWAIDFAGLAGRRPPASAVQNGALVYGAFTTRSFTAGELSPVDGAPYAPPGGTIYQPGTDGIYFPQGSTWGAVRRAPFISFDAHAYAYGLDSMAAWSARDALSQHLVGQRTLVSTNGSGDGRTYSYDAVTANSQDSYNGREEYAASQLAAGWLALYVSRNAWDQTFNMPALDGATYAPLPLLTAAATGWSSMPHGSSPDEERRTP